jgi:hypothetical protein
VTPFCHLGIEKNQNIAILSHYEDESWSSQGEIGKG